MHHSQVKNIKSYIVSIDQEKAFDKVDRDFLYKIMEKLVYSEIFINFIKKLYQNTESIISNNGYLSNPFPLGRGVRQECPLSLLLYIINAEVINLNIKTNKNIIGCPIPNQKEQLKLSQYADDTNLFVTTEESILEILNFFKKYKIATGATINISKTEITSMANAKIYNLDKKIQNIQITNPHNFIKILGIHFTNDLQQTSIYKWELCLSKLKTQLFQLSRRHLSLKGKATLLNTFILSKITFLSNIFPIPTYILKQIESNFFKHIWQFSTKKPMREECYFSLKLKKE